MEGYLGTVAYQLQTAARYLPLSPGKLPRGRSASSPLPLMLACKVLFNLLARVFHILDEKGRFTGRGYPKNYVVIARKPLISVS